MNDKDLKGKKILLVLTDLDLGGITTAAISLANELAQRHNYVDVLNMSKIDSNVTYKLNANIRILHLGGKSQKWSTTYHSLRSAKRIGDKLGICLWGSIKKVFTRFGIWYHFIFTKNEFEEEYDIAIAYRQCVPCYFYVLNCVSADIKVAFVHGELKYMGDISAWKRYLLDFEKVAYVSDAVRNEFFSQYPELKVNGVTVHNMLDESNIIQESSCRSQFDLSSNTFNIVTVTRVDNWIKGANRIVDVCKILKTDKRLHFHWYVIGDGPDLDQNIKYSKESNTDDVLSFVGSCINPYSTMRIADLFVLTSKSESFGLVIAESLVLHVPVVACEYSALHEIYTDGQEGLIAAQNAQDIADKITLLMTDKELYCKIRQNCSNYHYSNDIPFQQLTDIL